MNLNLFTNAIRIYLCDLLCASEGILLEYEQERVGRSFSKSMTACWTEVVANAKRLVSTIKHCQNDDASGIHPYFFVSGLAIISKVQECLQLSISACEHCSLRNFSSRLKISFMATRSSKLYQNALIAEREGDIVLAGLWNRAAGLFTNDVDDSVNDDQKVSIYNYSEQTILNELKRAREVMAKASKARSDGKIDLVEAIYRAAHLVRSCAVYFIINQNDNPTKISPHDVRYRAASLAIDVVDILEEKYALSSLTPTATLLFESAASSLNKAVELTLKLATTPAYRVFENNIVQKALKQEIEDAVRESRRLRGDAFGVTRLNEHVEEQLLRADECEMNASNCNHPPLQRVWKILGERYKIGVQTTKAYLDVVVLGQSALKEAVLLEEQARQVRSTNANIYSYTTELASIVHLLMYCKKIDATSQAILSDTTIKELIIRRDSLAATCVRQAIQYLSIAIDTGLTGLSENKSGELELSNSNDMKELMNCYKIIAGTFLNTLNGVLRLIQKHIIAAGDSKICVDIRKYLLCSCEFFLRAAEHKERQIQEHILLLNNQNITTSRFVLSGGELSPSGEVLLMEEAACAYEKVIEYEYLSRASLSLSASTTTPAYAKASGECVLLWEKVVSTQISIAESLGQLVEQYYPHIMQLTTRLRIERDALLALMTHIRDKKYGMKKNIKEKYELKTICLRRKVFIAGMHRETWQLKQNSAYIADKCMKNWAYALRLANSAIQQLENNRVTLFDEAVTYLHAAHYAATAAAAYQHHLVWDGFIFEQVAFFLDASAETSKEPKIAHIVNPLYRTIARLLLETANSVQNIFCLSISAVEESLPLIDDDSEVLGYAEDIVMNLISTANSLHNAVNNGGLIHICEDTVTVALALVHMQIEEVKELSRRPPDPITPSTYCARIAMLKVKMERRFMYAQCATCESGMLPHLWLSAVTSLDLVENCNCTEAQALAISDYFAAAADAFACQNYALSAAQEMAGRALKRVFFPESLTASDGDSSDGDNSGSDNEGAEQTNRYLAKKALAKEITLGRFKAAHITLAAQKAWAFGPVQIVGKLHKAAYIMRTIVLLLEETVACIKKKRQKLRRSIVIKYKEVESILKHCGYVFPDIP